MCCPSPVCPVYFLFVCSTLDAPVDWGLIQHLGRKAAVVYNPDDPWFQEYISMHQVMPGLEVSRV